MAAVTTYRVEEIDDDFFVLRVNDRYTRFFEALWEIPEGITYNAYLLRTREGAVLFDGWKKPFAGQLLEALESLIDPGELRYVVVNHMEPDHSGSLEDVLRWAPGARVLGSKLAGRMLSTYPRARERFTPVPDGGSLEVGGERIRFIYTPWLHWPETMVSWLESRRILVTCDVFGGYGVPYGLFDDECIRWEEAIRMMKKYVVTVIGHYRQWILKGLSKLESLGIEPRMIAPAHGLIWRRDPRAVIEVYRRLAEARPVEGKVLVLYGSMYGTVEKLARRLVCRLARAGYKPVSYGFTDSTRPLVSEVLTDAAESEAMVVAAPTYEAGVFPLIEYVVGEICWKAQGPRKVVIASSYGWGGVAARKLRETLESCGARVVRVIEYNAIGPAAISDEEAERVAAEAVEALRAA